MASDWKNVRKTSRFASSMCVVLWSVFANEYRQTWQNKTDVKSLNCISSLFLKAFLINTCYISRHGDKCKWIMMHFSKYLHLNKIAAKYICIICIWKFAAKCIRMFISMKIFNIFITMKIIWHFEYPAMSCVAHAQLAVGLLSVILTVSCLRLLAR